MPIEVTLLGIMTEVRLLQLAKTPSSIKVIPFGMVIAVSPLQPENADLPNEVTLPGMVTEVKPLQPWKA